MEALSALNHAVYPLFNNRKLHCLVSTTGCTTSIFQYARGRDFIYYPAQAKQRSAFGVLNNMCTRRRPSAGRLMMLKWKLSVPQHQNRINEYTCNGHLHTHKHGSQKKKKRNICLYGLWYVSLTQTLIKK